MVSDRSKALDTDPQDFLQLTALQDWMSRWRQTFLFCLPVLRPSKGKYKGRAEKRSKGEGTNHVVYPGLKYFPECGTLSAKTRRVPGKVGQVGDPIWEVSACASLELEAAKQIFLLLRTQNLEVGSTEG